MDAQSPAVSRNSNSVFQRRKREDISISDMAYLPEDDDLRFTAQTTRAGSGFKKGMSPLHSTFQGKSPFRLGYN